MVSEPEQLPPPWVQRLATESILPQAQNSASHHNRQGGGNCSVSDTINTLGGGHAIFETLTINVDNCGGVTSYPCKTLKINVDNYGGVTLYPCKTLTINVDKCGGVTS